MGLFSPGASGYLYVFAAAWLWSLIGPLSKICLTEGLTPLEVAFWRAAFGGICFFAQTACRGGLRIPLRHAAVFCVFGVPGVSLFFATLQISIQLSGAAMAMVLMYTAPAWVAVFSRRLFHEKFSGRKIAALGIAMAGTALVCLSGGSLQAAPSLLGIVCGLASGVCYAAHFPFYVWWKSRYSTATLYAYMLLGGAAALYPFVEFSPRYSAQVWAGLAALGVVTNYAAYLAYGRSLKLLSPVRAAVIGNMEPVLATLWVWLFWQENFSLDGWVGSALVIAAVFLLTTDRDTR
ncbi:MAG: EamA family transporter [Desulfovibrionaceae bacterium]|nr:EamA family transporter [Desulfovibrionaceae bacterium]